ncbi:heme exporter protein CcmD [Oligella ureolytica]|nr:heme exporter protein CcmD [Alcaligenaceae bacterium]HZJ98274.1 heme exporter protein CcmD [Oligella sp.]
MYWQSLSDFLTMGGHGVYVWSVFFLTVLCVAIELGSLAQLKQKTINRFRRIRLLASKKGNK